MVLGGMEVTVVAYPLLTALTAFPREGWRTQASSVNRGGVAGITPLRLRSAAFTRPDLGIL